MNFTTFIIIILSLFMQLPSAGAQVDTVELKSIVHQLESSEDHQRFWQNLLDRDQAYRGIKTSKINDLENLISAVYYLNKHGYPSSDIKASSAMPLIWIHSPYPLVNQITFPIIIAGYESGQISEIDIRTYYIRNKYWRIFFNEEFRTKDLNVIYDELNLSVSPRIKIDDILTAYNESVEFLNQDFEIIGHWSNPKGQTTVRIIKSENGEYYFHDLYVDDSHYPERLIQDEQYPTLFRNYYKPEYYFGIQPNGDLSIKNSFEKRTYRPVNADDK